MYLFDSHCHINDPAFDDDRNEVIRRMRAASVDKAVVVGDAKRDCEDVYKLIDENEFLYGAYGLHPHDADEWTDEIPLRIAVAFKHKKLVALGEIGLDYHYDFSPRETQKEVFRKQLRLAYELDKPVILHIREAHGDAYEILNGCFKVGCMPKGIMHCYGGSLESALDYIRMGLYISFSGSLTFKNTPVLTRCAENLPLEKLLIETDCPYMSPVPMRGKRNEPTFVKYTCEKLAAIKGVTPEKVAEATYNNACAVFNIT